MECSWQTLHSIFCGQTVSAPWSRILSNRDRKVMTVMEAARMSLTGSATKTANTGSGRMWGRRKIRG